MALRLNHLLMLGFLALISLAAQMSTLSGQQTDVDLKERFLREAPQAWKAYINFASHLHVKVMGVRFKTPEQFRNEYKIGDKGFLHIGDVTVSGANRYYTFSLKRRDRYSAWVLGHLQLHSDQRVPDRERDSLLQQRICLGLTFVYLWLPRLVEEPEFKIKSILPYRHNGEDLVRLEFDYLKEQNPNMLQIKGGWMILDPQHDWIMREYEWNNEFRRTIHIREGKDKHPMVERVTVVGTGLAKDRPPSEFIYETSYEPSIPESEFMVSAFGLPEPAGIPAAASSSRWRWIIGAALGLLVLGVGWRRLGRRSRLREAK